jgi:O-antigen/teichoic acid export membrane protein
MFASLYAASSGLSTLLDFGSSVRWTREISRSRDLASYHHWLARRTVAQLPIVILFGALANTIVGANVLSRAAVSLLCVQALTATLSFGSLAAVRALVSPSRAAWFIFAGNSFFLLCAAASPTTSLDVLGALGASGSWLITTALALGATRKLRSSRRIPSMGNPWTGTAGFGLFGLAVALQPFDVVIVGALAGADEAGRIAAVSRWVQPVLLITYAYGTNVFPSLAAARSDHDAISELRSAIYVVFAVVGVSLAIFVSAPWLVSALLGPGYGSSVLVLRLLALWCIPVAVNQPCVAFLQARGQERFLAFVTLAVTTVNLAAIAAFARVMGATAIPIFSLVGSAALSMILVSRVRRTGLARAT